LRRTHPAALRAGVKAARSDARVRLGNSYCCAMKRLRCRLGRHRYRRLRNEDGEFYDKCKDCGKFRDVPRTPTGLIGL
jgi:hypothetical protein